MPDVAPIDPDSRSGVVSYTESYLSEVCAGDAAGPGDNGDPVEEIGGDMVRRLRPPLQQNTDCVVPGERNTYGQRDDAPRRNSQCGCQSIIPDRLCERESIASPS